MEKIRLTKDAGGSPVQEVFMIKKHQRLRVVSGEVCISTGSFDYPILRLAPDIPCFVVFGDDTVKANITDMLLPANVVEVLRVDETITNLSARPSGEVHGFLSIAELG